MSFDRTQTCLLVYWVLVVFWVLIFLRLTKFVALSVVQYPFLSIFGGACTENFTIEFVYFVNAMLFLCELLIGLSRLCYKHLLVRPDNGNCDVCLYGYLPS